MKCNYCGWSKTEINLADYVASKGVSRPVVEWHFFAAVERSELSYAKNFGNHA
jgi:hypothetical protein